MAWHYTATPDQVQPELGPNLLDGDYSAANPEWTGAGPWSRTGGGRFALTVDDPHTYLTLTPDAVYTITVEVRGADTVSWDMTLQNPDGDQVVLPVGDVDATPTDDWVTVIAEWRAPVDPLTGSPAVTATGPGTVEIRNPVMAVQTGRVILTVPGDVLAETIMASGGIVAGTPGGARVELTDEGLAAFDVSGTETVRIQGEGGEFVGGSFRTTDGLPGQVLLSDEGYVDSENQAKYPGIRIIPVDSSDLVTPPGIGPNLNGFVITGGRNTTGGRGFTIYSPSVATMSFVEGNTRSDVKVSKEYAWIAAYGENGNKGEILATPTLGRVRSKATDGAEGLIQATSSDALVGSADPGGKFMSIIRSNGREAFLRSNGPDGVGRILSVDSDGVWAKTNESGTWQNISLVPQVRQFQYSPLWNMDLSPSPIMVQHLPGGKLCQAQARIQNLSGSSLSLPYDEWITLNLNPIPADLRGGNPDYIDITLPQLNARGRVEMDYSTGSIRIKNLHRNDQGGITISWEPNNSIWFPMRWFTPN